MSFSAPASPSLWVNTRIRSTPFSSHVELAGVTAYSVYNHMLLPVAFESLEADYWHLKQHVQVWDVASQRQVELRGPDATRLMQLMTPRDITTAEPGRCLYAPLVGRRGGMVNDPVILKISPDRYWISIADSDVLLWADGLASGLDMRVEVFEPDVSPLAIQGPLAEELGVRVFGEELRELKFFRFGEMWFRGRPMLVARTGWSKQGGFEVYIDDPRLASELWSTLFELGGDLGVRAGCPNLIERIEGGLLSYGGDLDRTYNPFECGFDRFVHLDEPIEFLGRSALEAIAVTGPSRRIVGIELETDSMSPCRTAWAVDHAGRSAGWVTSAAHSPSRGTGVAIATLVSSVAVSGATVRVDSPDGRLDGTVTDLPFG